MSTTRKPLADLLDPDGKQSWAQPMRPTSTGDKPVKVCPECGQHVVFTKSERTGNWYLCEVYTRNATVYNERTKKHYRQYEWDAATPHFKHCARRKEISDSLTPWVAQMTGGQA